MSDLGDLREKLDKALSNFQKEGEKNDIQTYKAEYAQLLRITKDFTNLQQHIQSNENELAELHIKKNVLEKKIELELKRIKDNIFDELIWYKNVKEKSEVDDLLYQYQNKSNEDMHLNDRYNKYIKHMLMTMNLSLKNDEFLYERLNNISENKITAKKHLPLKAAGLDPALYQFYSSSDDSKTNESPSNNIDESLLNKHEEKEANNESRHENNHKNKNRLTLLEYHQNEEQELLSDKNTTDQYNSENKTDTPNSDIAATMKTISVGKKKDEQLNVEMRISRIKDEIINEENTNKFNLETKHGAKEKIHILFRKLTLNKLEMTELLLQQTEAHIKAQEELENCRAVSENDVRILIQKERILANLLLLLKEANKVQEIPETKSIKMKIEKKLLILHQKIIKDKEKVNDFILSEVQSVISQGSLESDTRFLEKLEKQLKDIEKFDTPRFFKISVQLEIAKKYVKDIIYLKKKAFLENYYNIK